MAFLSIKSTCFLLIITIAFSSSFGGVETQIGGAVKGLGNLGKGIRGFGTKAAPAIKNAADEGLQNLGVAALKMKGEDLAGKVFGPAGKTGFRWGWNGSKYYFKVANKCEQYEGSLTHYCPRPSLVPFLGWPQPNCAIQCVIEFASRYNDGTPVACTSFNVDSCRYEVEEAECDRGLLTQKSCTFIRV